MKDLFGQGCKLYIDNWCASETLFLSLEDNGTAACGTAHSNNLWFPDTFKQAPLPKSDYRFRWNNNLLGLLYHDKRNFYALYHAYHEKANIKQVAKNSEESSKLHIVDHCNQHMVRAYSRK